MLGLQSFRFNQKILKRLNQPILNFIPLSKLGSIYFNLGHTIPRFVNISHPMEKKTLVFVALHQHISLDFYL